MAQQERRISSWAMLAGFIALCLAVGAVGGWITARSVTEWYPTLTKPAWTPPNSLFGPVWTALYIMMAFAAWLVWRKDARFAGVRVALILFFVQLALNFLWSFLFFGLKAPGLALIDIAALLLVLALTVWAFFQQSRWAGLIMLPYLAWVGFATALNFAIWRLN
ncbi:MAG: tryptophan-rich sensory protein [Rhizobiales bacterium]|nr:tryptophan-rich sensory protein [Hyphomicrobiales bacterium]